MYTKSKNDLVNKILYIIFIITVLINMLFVFQHTMWRDETQAWLIARDTNLMADSLFRVTSYEGHPFLWFLMLMPFAKIGLPAVTIKYISAACMIIALYLFLFKTEFPIYIKILAVCSPMFFYGYWVPARSYSLAALFMVLLLVYYDKRNDKPILYGIILALLLQTLVIYAGFVFALSVCWMIEVLKMLKSQENKKTRLQIRGLSTVFLSALFLLWEFRYTGSAINSQDVENSLGFMGEVHKFIYTAYVCANDLFGEYYLLVVFSLLLVGVALIVIKRDFDFLLSLCIGIAWQIWIYAFVYPHPSSNRLISWIYIVVFLFCTLAKYNEEKIIFANQEFGKILWTFMAIFFVIVLKYHCTDAIEEMNPERTFSTSKEVAAVLNLLPSDSAIFISSSDYDSAVVAQIDCNHTIWSPFTGDKASFVLRNPNEPESIDCDEFIDEAREMFPDKKEIFVVSQLDEETDCIHGLAQRYFEEDGSIESVYGSEKSPISGEYFYILKVNL